MKLNALTLVKFAIVLSIFCLSPADAQVRKPRPYVTDELLVKFAPGTKVKARSSSLRQVSSQELESLGDLGWVRVKLKPGEDVQDAMARFADLAGVTAVQPNYYYILTNTPDDPMFPNSGMYGLLKISAPTAWNTSTGSQSVVVADIDTGMRYTHEDLAPNLWTNSGEIPNNGIDDDGDGYVDDYHGYDFRYNDPDPMDENGHGTHTAGTIGAAGNNALGVVGVNWHVTIMPVKIYSAGGTDSTSAMVINAYNYVRTMKERGVNIRVTNNSYGDCPETCGYDQATKDALDALGNAGVLNVFAAGNNGRNIDTTPFFPASYDSPHILTVAASDNNDNKASFSNYGVASVDIAAPGLGILSTWDSSDSGYTSLSGTSMATPHVAGAAALLAAYNPDLSVASLKATLMNSVDHLPQWAGVVKSGGRLNIANALVNQTVCDFQLSSDQIHVGTKGGFFAVNVEAPQNCDFNVKSSAAWAHVYSSDVMSGSGTVIFRVTVAPTVSRETTISIAGHPLVIKQVRGLNQ